MAKTPIEKLDEKISDLLSDFDYDVSHNFEEIATQAGKWGAQTLRQTSPIRQTSPKQSGYYARGWTSTVKKLRYGTQVVIHNKNAPGLAHLLEYDHALPQGGRSKPYPHIKVVEEEINEQVERRIVHEITGY